MRPLPTTLDTELIDFPFGVDMSYDSCLRNIFFHHSLGYSVKKNYLKSIFFSNNVVLHSTSRRGIVMESSRETGITKLSIDEGMFIPAYTTNRTYDIDVLNVICFFAHPQ